MKDIQFTSSLQALFPALKTPSPCTYLSSARTALNGMEFVAHAYAFTPLPTLANTPQVHHSLIRTALKIPGLIPDALALIEGLFCPFPTDRYYHDYGEQKVYSPSYMSKFVGALATSTSWMNIISSSRIMHTLALVANTVRPYLLNEQEESIRVTNAFHAAVAWRDHENIRRLIQNPYLNIDSQNQFIPYQVAVMDSYSREAALFYHQTRINTFIAATFTLLSQPSNTIADQLTLHLIKRADVLDWFQRVAITGVMSSGDSNKSLAVNPLHLAIEKNYPFFLNELFKVCELLSKEEARQRQEQMLESGSYLESYTPEGLTRVHLNKISKLLESSKNSPYQRVTSLTPLAHSLLAGKDQLTDFFIEKGTVIGCSRKPKAYPYASLAILDCKHKGLHKLLSTQELCLQKRDKPIAFDLTHALCDKKTEFTSLFHTLQRKATFSLLEQDKRENTLFHQIAHELNALFIGAAKAPSIPKQYNWLFDLLKKEFPKLNCILNEENKFPSEVFSKKSLRWPKARSWQRSFTDLQTHCELD